MKTTVDIPEKELKELMENTNSSVKRDAIVAAITDFNRRKRLEKLSRHIGTFKQLLSQKELQSLRKRD